MLLVGHDAKTVPWLHRCRPDETAVDRHRQSSLSSLKRYHDEHDNVVVDRIALD
jgi:hypothetical protein